MKLSCLFLKICALLAKNLWSDGRRIVVYNFEYVRTSSEHAFAKSDKIAIDLLKARFLPNLTIAGKKLF